MFLFFKPHEMVQGEKFDIELTFKNVEGKFYGGSFDLSLVCPNLGDFHLDLKTELPQLEQGQSNIILKEDLILYFNGTYVLKLKNQMHYSHDGVLTRSPYLYYSLTQKVRDGSYFPLPFTTREELYQKYSVIVALWTAAISIIISTLSILFSVLRL